MNQEEIELIFEQLKNKEIARLDVSKEDFLSFRLSW